MPVIKLNITIDADSEFGKIFIESVKRKEHFRQEFKKDKVINLDAFYIMKRGAYFGYPVCCINYFVHNVEGLNKGVFPEYSELQINASEHTGFIPCPECADKVVKGYLKLTDLLINRKCLKSFPHES